MNDQGLTPLHHAAAHGKTDTVLLLLDFNADVNKRDSDKENMDQ